MPDGANLDAARRFVAGRDRVSARLPNQAAASELIDRAVREVVFRRAWQIVQEVEDG